MFRYWAVVLFAATILVNPALASTLSIQDFEGGLPTGTDTDGNALGFLTFTSTTPGPSIATTTTPPSQPTGVAVGNAVLQMDTTPSSFSGFVEFFANGAFDTWTPQDWSAYDGISFNLFGQGTGATLSIGLLDNRFPTSTTDDAERWDFDFADDIFGWRQISFDWASLARVDIGNGAPNDGLQLTDVHGWFFSVRNGTSATSYYLDDLKLTGGPDAPDGGGSAVVPLPAGLILLMTGLMGIGGNRLLRRRLR